MKELIEKIEDKINEAENCEDIEITEEYLKGYKNGLTMAIELIKESCLNNKVTLEDFIEMYAGNLDNEDKENIISNLRDNQDFQDMIQTETNEYINKNILRRMIKDGWFN